MAQQYYTAAAWLGDINADKLPVTEIAVSEASNNE